MTRARTAVFALAAVVAVSLAPERASASVVADYVKTARLLQEWQFEAARAEVDKLIARKPKAPETRYLQGELTFLDGDYAGALAHLDGLDDADVFGNVGQLRSLATTSLEATEGFASYESPGGHFVIYYPPGKDEVIVELAASVLEQAYEVLGSDLGYAPKRKIRVEILSRPQDLAKVSTLTEKDIETTGTIALCKYGKLMVVTPRATLFGYSWMDTLVHEYVHYVVSAASRDKVPVWLQEGIARFEETRWRRAPGADLNKVEQHLLASALKARRLISFDDMHPSMAKLPSAEAAGLAFAEVYTMVGYIHDKRGYAGIRKAIALTRDGKSAKRAVAEVMGKRFNQVEKDWKRHLAKRGLERAPALAKRTGRVRIKKSDDSEVDDNAGIDQVASDEARKYARLGGLLRARNMPAAAAIEYEKALAKGGEDPFVAGKLARTYLELSEYERAIELATPLLDIDDTDPVPATTLGVAYLAVGQAKESARSFELALRINPFDPGVRCGLAQAYKQTGNSALSQRERKACDMLTEHAPTP